MIGSYGLHRGLATRLSLVAAGTLLEAVRIAATTVTAAIPRRRSTRFAAGARAPLALSPATTAPPTPTSLAERLAIGPERDGALTAIAGIGRGAPVTDR
jgi:hypothetical protein